MNKKYRFAYTIVLLVLVFIVFAPDSKADTKDIFQSSTVKKTSNDTKVISNNNVSLITDDIKIDDTISSLYCHSARSTIYKANSRLLTDCEVAFDEFDFNCDYSVTNTWDFSDLVKGPSSIPLIRRTTMVVSSNSPKSVTVSITLNAAKKLKRLGIKELKVQRCYKRQWLTVSTITNKLSYNTSRFYFSRTITSLVTNARYRVTATFIADNGIAKTCISRTSGIIHCR